MRSHLVFRCSANHRELHVLTHSFPTRRSSGLEPVSKCVARHIDDNAVQTPNLWGRMGVFSGTLYEREQAGELVYSTRKLPGSRVYLKFTVHTPPGEQEHAGLGRAGKPQLDRPAQLSRAAAQATGVAYARLGTDGTARAGLG